MFLQSPKEDILVATHLSRNVSEPVVSPCLQHFSPSAKASGRLAERHWPLGDRLPAVDFRRCSVVQRFMPSILVVESEIPIEPVLQRRNVCVILKIHVLVFHSPPQPLDEDIVKRPASSVHADPNIRFHTVSEVLARKL